MATVSVHGRAITLAMLLPEYWDDLLLNSFRAGKTSKRSVLKTECQPSVNAAGSPALLGSSLRTWA